MSKYFDTMRKAKRPTKFDELTEEYLIERIISTNKHCWKMKITEKEIRDWLQNFKGEKYSESEERILALYLLAHFVIYNFEEFKYLCKEAFSNYIKEASGKHQITNPEILEIVKNTVFLPLGNPSESSTSMMYYFRTENNLHKDCFDSYADREEEIVVENEDAIEMSETSSDYKKTIRVHENKNLVFMDDITSSGQQFYEYYTDMIKKGTLDADSPSIYVIFLIANCEAERTLKEIYPNVKFIKVIDIDERSDGVSENSYIYHNNREMMEKCNALMQHYGNKIHEFYINSDFVVKPLGHGGKAQMFGFYYNIPDNVSPIFWEHGQIWRGIFRRHKKSYNKEIRGEFFDEYVKFI